MGNAISGVRNSGVILDGLTALPESTSMLVVDQNGSMSVRPLTTTVQALKSLVGTTGQTVSTDGYYALGDCEPLAYKWDAASVATDDGYDSTHPGLVIQPTSVSGAGRWVANVTTGRVNVRWYGASPTLADNKPYIQKCIDIVVHSSTLPKHVYIPGGVYTCASGILCKKDSNGDKVSEFFSICIEGEGGFPYGITPYTKLSFTHTDTFGLAIQTGKGIRIRALELVGMNTFSFATPRLAYTSDESGYVINGCRDNTNSPYSGIVIDPFGSAAGTSAGNRYPTYDAEYPAGQGNGGTTDLKVDDCRISGWVCNIMVTPNGNTQNAEQMDFSRIRTEQCKVAFAFGQLQSRSITIKDFTSWGNVLYFVNTSLYGAGSGQPPYIYGGNMAGHMKYFMYSTGSSVAMTRIENLFMESLYSIGKINIDLLIFDGCILKWGIPDASVATPHTFLSASKMVKFDGCFLFNSANGPNTKPLSFAVVQLQFKDCVFDTLPTNYTSFDDYVMKHCKVRHLNGSISGNNATISTDEICYGSPMSNRASAIVGWNQGFSETASNRTAISVSPHQNREALESGSVTLTVDSATNTATFTSADGTRWDPTLRGSVPVQLQNFVADEWGVTNYPTCFVVSVSGNTVTLSGLPPQVTTGSYLVYAMMPFRYHPPMIGNTTNGSNVITNVVPTGIVQTNYRVGENIRGSGIPIGTYITARDNATNTITLSRNCTATATGIDLYDADLKWTARAAAAPSTGSWQKGTLVDDSTGASNGWRCTVSGTFGSASVPTFVAR